MSDTQTLIDAAEVAKRLGVSRRTVERFARAGTIPCVRLSVRALRFDPVDVERYIAARKIGSAS